MLVLTRKSGEAVIVDGEITIRISGVVGNRVKLAVDAPRHWPIRRVETLILPETASPDLPPVVTHFE